MKKWICILINKITFGKVCLDWCKVNKAEAPTIKPIVKKEKPLVKKKKTKKGKKTSITAEMRNQFIKDKKNGMSYKAIGEKHGVAASSVSYHIKKSK
jgi:hypothetical protein